MKVNGISMYFRYHNIETKANNFSNLNFRIWANGWFLAGLHVNMIRKMDFYLKRGSMCNNFRGTKYLATKSPHLFLFEHDR